MTNFELTRDGVKPIQISLENMSPQQIYTKTLAWVEKNYENPQEVLKATIESKSIKIAGFKALAWYYMGFGFKHEFDMDYTLQIDIQDNEVTLTFTPGKFSSGGQEAPFTSEIFFDYTGEVDWQYKDAKPSMEKTMNEIASSLIAYLK